MKTIGIYAGRFQPPHRGHLDIYKQMKQVTGADTFIATSDKVELPDSPLNFQEKQQIWVKHGVPASNIIKVKSTYKPDEITAKFDAGNTAAIFAVGEKDVERFGGRKVYKDGKEVWVKADGVTPGYFQPYKGNEGDMKPLKEHGYMWVVPQPKFINIGGKKLSGTVARNSLSHPGLTEEQRRKVFQLIFGWFDIGLYNHLVSKFTEAKQFTTTPSVKPIDKKITEGFYDAGFFLDVYNQNGEIFTTHQVKNERSVMKQVDKLFQWYGDTIQQIVIRNSEGQTIQTITPESRKQVAERTAVKRLINQIIFELLNPPASAIPSGTDGVDGMDTLSSTDAIQRRKDADQARKDAMKAKGQAERDLKALEADKKWKEKDILSLKKDKLPNKKKEIDALNKQISGGRSSSDLTEFSKE